MLITCKVCKDQGLKGMRCPFCHKIRKMQKVKEEKKHTKADAREGFTDEIFQAMVKHRVLTTGDARTDVSILKGAGLKGVDYLAQVHGIDSKTWHPVIAHYINTAEIGLDVAHVFARYKVPACSQIQLSTLARTMSSIAFEKALCEQLGITPNEDLCRRADPALAELQERLRRSLRKEKNRTP